MRFLVALAAVAISSTAAAAQAVPITLSEFKIEMGRDTVSAGTVKFNIKNEGSTTHAFYIKGEGANKGSREVAAGESASFSLPLKENEPAPSAWAVPVSESKVVMECAYRRCTKA